MLTKKRNKKPATNQGALEWWFDYPCVHQNAECGFYGHSLHIGCNNCNKKMNLLLNPETHMFDATTGPNDDKRKSVSPDDMVKFVGGLWNLYIPSPPGDINGVSPEKDTARFYETLDVFKHHGFNVMNHAIKIDSTNKSITCSCCGHRNIPNLKKKHI